MNYLFTRISSFKRGRVGHTFAEELAQMPLKYCSDISMSPKSKEQCAILPGACDKARITIRVLNFRHSSKNVVRECLEITRQELEV